MLDMNEVRSYRRYFSTEGNEVGEHDWRAVELAMSACLALLTPETQVEVLKSINDDFDVITEGWQKYLDEQKEEYGRRVADSRDDEVVKLYRVTAEQLMRVKLYRLEFDAHLPIIAPMTREVYASCGDFIAGRIFENMPIFSLPHWINASVLLARRFS